MSEIPAIYWMIVVGAVTVMFCLVLYYLAMLIKEGRDAVRDSREIIKNANKMMEQATVIVNDVQEVVSSVKRTVGQVNEAILIPIRKIGNTVSMVGDFLGGLKK